MVTVDAEPSPFTLDIEKTVVLVIDMQNDFAAQVECLSVRESMSP